MEVEVLLAFDEHYRQVAQPFDWTFTRADLTVLHRVANHETNLRPARERTCGRVYY